MDSDIRAFLNVVYEKAFGFSTLFNQADIVDRCASRFELSGYPTKLSVLEDCDQICNDDFGLKEDKAIPIRLVNTIYKAIQDMRKNCASGISTLAFSPEKVMEKSDSHILLNISKKGVITSSGKSFIVNGIYTAKVSQMSFTKIIYKIPFKFRIFSIFHQVLKLR